MAFTDTQKAQIRKYLGYGDRYRQEVRDLEVAFLGLTAEGEVQITVELARCLAIDTEIDASRLNFIVNEVSGIKLSSGTGGELELLRSAGRQAAGRMATIMGIPLIGDAFSESSSGPMDNMLRIG